MAETGDRKFDEMLARLREKTAEKKAEKSLKKVEEPKAEEKVEKKAEEKPAKEVLAEVSAVAEEKKEEKKDEKKEEVVIETSDTTETKVGEVTEKKVRKSKKTETKVESEPVKSGRSDIEGVPGGAPIDELIDYLKGLKKEMATVEDAISLRSKGGMSKVVKTYSEKGEIVRECEGDSELIEVPAFVGPTATVSADFGATVNLGDYNSGKVNVFVSVPCYLTQIDEAFKFASKKAKELLHVELDSLKKERE